MGVQLGAFPDAETVVMTLLEQVAPTVTSTPAGCSGSAAPMTGSPSAPRMEIACYGTDRTQAWQLAERCRRLILASVRTEVAGVLIDTARTDNPPTQVPYATTEDVRRVTAYHRFFVVHNGSLIKYQH